ncbi:hypothetical protein [Legionella fallonii]|uniref:Uncharacterized protein n=1 Tax=Legionella fallonii LLAP-10 TaxID=1212491 RepID=A0A098G436_9GAMM|nr:hypothetical protein [Legionella fallonii]CEG56744.1 conserved exported protein of unknown function [Legionella fallonii LLAP-10]
MELISKNIKSCGTSRHRFLRSTLTIALLGLAGAVYSYTAVSSGQLVIINGLGNDASTGATGSTASSVSVVVSDSTGPCSTTALVAYNGTVVVKWASSATHSATSCTGITSVAVTPIKTTVGSVSTIVYDSVSTTTVPAATATAAITYTPPTTAYANLALIITGAGVPASAVTASATVWGVGAASAPVFDTGNGGLTTVGVPGGIGAAGLKAETMMRHHAIIPMREEG